MKTEGDNSGNSVKVMMVGGLVLAVGAVAGLMIWKQRA